jgi:hypothetical protein
MKNSRRISMGLVLLNIFLVSTVVLIIILLCKILPQEKTGLLVNIWLAEMFILIVYCLLFYDAGKGHKAGGKKISVLRH